MNEKQSNKIFNQIADYTKVNLQKRDVTFQKNIFGTAGLMPFWVADMDFEASFEIKEALRQRVEKGIFGYERDNISLKQSAINWFERRHNWKMETQYLRMSPSIMTSIGILIKILTKEGDGILVQTPVFPKFLQIVPNNNRKLIENPLKLINGKYEIDFEDFEEKVKEVKVLILCNPHNPVGRVWRKEELEKLGKIAKENGVYILSDEIHSDIIFKGHKFIPYGVLPKELTDMSVSLLSPAKTFNIPSISGSFVYTQNKEILEKFDKFMLSMYLGDTSILNLIAMETAYNTGDAWLDELLVHIEENINLIRAYLKKNIPQIKMIEPDGMYLVWLDFRELNIDDKKMNKLLVEAGLALNLGFSFGKEGNGFLRMNIGTTREYVEKGLEILKSVVKNIN